MFIKWLKKVWLKIWNKIKCLFWKREMEIYETMNSWFGELQNKLTQVEDDPEIDSYFRSIFAVFYNYHNATIILIKHGCTLPAMGLIRINSELCIKFLWCLHGTTNHQEVKDRIQSWVKSSGNKKKKLFEDFLVSGKISDKTKELFQNLKDNVKKQIDAIPQRIKEMPNITGNGGLFEQTSGVFGDDVSAQLYGQFCPAVHIDTTVIAQCIEREGHILRYKGDLDYNQNDLFSYCVTQLYMFIKILYKFYHWDDNQIEQQYQKFISDIKS